MKRLSRTCIAVIRLKNGKVLMAGDRRVSCDWGFSYTCPYPKIAKKENGILIGASGDSGLCKLCVDVFEPPELIVPANSKTNDTLTYMYWTFLPALTKLIKSQPGYIDEHRILRLALNESCSLLVAVTGDVYQVDIMNPEEDIKEYSLGRIIIDDAPAPFAIGCGADTAYSVLLNKKKEHKHNTKEHLIQAVEQACEVSPGCGLPIDIISE